MRFGFAFDRLRDNGGDQAGPHFSCVFNRLKQAAGVVSRPNRRLADRGGLG
jgi:hypothetical protein